MEVNDNILIYLKKNRITVNELAQNLGIAPPNLLRMLKADDMKVSLLIRIANFLEVSPALFINPEETVDNEEVQNLKAELNEKNNYSSLFVDYMKMLVDIHFNKKIEILKNQFSTSDPKVLEKVIQDAVSKRDERKADSIDFNAVMRKLAEEEYHADEEKLLNECKQEIKQANRTPAQTEILRTRARTIKRANDKSN